jgi:PAS domain S-box-containing protein
MQTPLFSGIDPMSHSRPRSPARPRAAGRTARGGSSARRIHASEALFRAIADQAPMMVWTCSAEGTCTFFNRSWLEFTGRSLASELGRGWLHGVHEDDRGVVGERFRQAAGARAPFTLEYRLMRADGQYRWLLGHGSPLSSRNGRVPGCVGSCVDVTDRKIDGDTVMQAQGRFRLLVDYSRDMVCRTQVFPEHRIEFISGAASAITGHAPEEFYDDPNLAAKLVHPEDVHLLTQALRDPTVLAPEIVLRWVHADGRIVWAEHRRVPVYDASGRLVAIEGLARDVTDRIETQRRLRESEEQMRQLAARVQSTREEERAALARELHDELGQTLTAVKLEIGRATSALTRDRVTPHSVDRLQSLFGLVEIGIETVKRLATDLRPPALDHLGLAAAIRWEAMAFRSRTGLRCTVRASKDHTRLTKDQQVVLFRIFQETLTNIVRHAQASAVHVVLVERARTFELRIRDNGGGITDAEIRDPRSIGLLGMKERATLVGGTFEITGRRGKGTVVTVRVPLGDPAERPGTPRPPALKRR